MGLWNCQFLVNKSDLIPAIASQTALSILGLTETWIRPEDSATPDALSNNFSFSLIPHQVRKGGGTGLLISKNYKYSTYNPLCNNYSLESHAITVTAPCYSHLSTFWAIGHLPRRAGWLVVLNPRGWQSTCSLWWLQYSFGQALCCKFPFNPIVIWLKTPYHHKHSHIWQPAGLNLHTQLCCRQRFGKTPTHLWPLLHNI